VKLSLPPADSAMANMDTLRPYNDLQLFIDQNNWVHAVFTTLGYYYYGGGHAPTDSRLLWHWSEEFPSEAQAVADGWYEALHCGAWNASISRPIMAQDSNTGYLYCLYQRYDTSTVSQGGYYSADVEISVSTNGGEDWSVGTNVTRTTSPAGALPDECLSEINPSMAEIVDDECHLSYVLDRDAGSVLWDEGTWSFNQVKYHSVPVDSIPTTPLILQGNYSLHQRCWNVGTKESASKNQPHSYITSRVYPNPFNPTTVISFQLQVASQVKLDVFDIHGRNVRARRASSLSRSGTTPITGNYSPGAHHITFDGSGLPSGIYIYRLTADKMSGSGATPTTASGKMVLLK